MAPSEGGETDSAPSSARPDPSIEEPEAEMSRRRSGSHAEVEEIRDELEQAVEGPRVPVQMNEEWRRMYERSQMEANRLDGLPPPG